MESAIYAHNYWFPLAGPNITISDALESFIITQLYPRDFQRLQ